jgi:hypothetical protein
MIGGPAGYEEGEANVQIEMGRRALLTAMAERNS